VALDHLPEPTWIREVRSAFVHEARGAARERPVDDVAVASDPADVGRAPVEISLVEVEDVLARDVRPREVPGARVLDPLGLAGRP
jgi:hypothetical protein